METPSGINRLVGCKVNRIFMNEDNLKFETDKGNIVFFVSGDCCSRSVFYDFIGVKKIIGNTIIKVEEIDLIEGDKTTDNKNYQESISVYGFRLITNDSQFGEVSSVFSFRNYSNGYYGGCLYDTEDVEVNPEIFDDVIETQCPNDK